MKTDIQEKILILMDFILSQILSILFFSNIGVSIGKREDNRIHFFHNGCLNPIVALYPKAVTTKRNKTFYEGFSNPCHFTTSYSVQILSKTFGLISNEPKLLNTESFYPELVNDIKELSMLQISYCMERLDITKINIFELVAIFEAGISFTSNIIPLSSESEGVSSHLNDWLLYLKDKIQSLYDPKYTTSFELGLMATALSKYNKTFGFNNRDLFLSEIVLELLNRKNHNGLIAKGSYDKSTACLAHQFLTIESLLLSYPYVKLDSILDKAFSLFNVIYRLAWNEALGCFSFRRYPSIQYSSFDLGAIIRCLKEIAHWTEKEDDKIALESILNESYIGRIIIPLANSLKHDIHDIKKHSESVCLGKSILLEEDKSTVKQIAIFPERITLKFPGPSIHKSYKKSIVRLWKPLFLYLALLEFMESYMVESDLDDNNLLLNFLLNFI